MFFRIGCPGTTPGRGPTVTGGGPASGEDVLFSPDSSGGLMGDWLRSDGGEETLD